MIDIDRVLREQVFKFGVDKARALVHESMLIEANKLNEDARSLKMKAARLRDNAKEFRRVDSALFANGYQLLALSMLIEANKLNGDAKLLKMKAARLREDAKEFRRGIDFATGYKLSALLHHVINRKDVADQVGIRCPD